jgi:hypothetical protein
MILVFVAEPGLGPGLIETALPSVHAFLIAAGLLNEMVSGVRLGLRQHGELSGTTETPEVCDCLADYKNPAR